MKLYTTVTLRDGIVRAPWRGKRQPPTGRRRIGKEAARAWIERWDAQQQDHLPDREDRFTALLDAVEAGVGRLTRSCSTWAADPARWRSAC